MNVRDLIKRHEGLTLTAKPDAKGKYAIGYGHDIDPPTEPLHWTPEQAEAQLDIDLRQATYDCELHIPQFIALDEVRQAVMIDMAYEMGIHGLLGFHDFLHAVYFARWPQAVIEMQNSKWAHKDAPHRAAEDEQMMVTGEWLA